MIPDLEKLLKRPTASEFIGKLFSCRDVIHLAHLRTQSYAQHIALNNYYDSLLDLIDTLAESYQGIYGLLTISIPEIKSEDPLTYITQVYKWIDSSRSIFKESFIQNIIDEIQLLNAQTLYKLKNLK